MYSLIMGRLIRCLPILILAVLLLFQPSCGAVAPLQEKDQERARLELREQFAISQYPGKSQGEVLDAAEKVLRRLDENGDFSFKLTENGLLASRDWTLFGILIGQYARYYFVFRTRQSEDGLELTISGLYRHKHGDFGWSRPHWDKYLDEIPYSGAWGSAFVTFLTADDYRLLHNQIRYELGLSDHWFSCEEARTEKLETELYWTPFLCYEHHGWDGK